MHGALPLMKIVWDYLSPASYPVPAFFGRTSLQSVWLQPLRPEYLPRYRSGWRMIISKAIRDLAEAGAVEVLQAKNTQEIRAILSILTIFGALEPMQSSS